MRSGDWLHLARPANYGSSDISFWNSHWVQARAVRVRTFPCEPSASANFANQPVSVTVCMDGVAVQHAGDQLRPYYPARDGRWPYRSPLGNRRHRWPIRGLGSLQLKKLVHLFPSKHVDAHLAVGVKTKRRGASWAICGCVARLTSIRESRWVRSILREPQGTEGRGNGGRYEVRTHHPDRDMRSPQLGLCRSPSANRSSAVRLAMVIKEPLWTRTIPERCHSARHLLTLSRVVPTSCPSAVCEILTCRLAGSPCSIKRRSVLATRAGTSSSVISAMCWSVLRNLAHKISTTRTQALGSRSRKDNTSRRSRIASVQASSAVASAVRSLPSRTVISPRISSGPRMARTISRPSGEATLMRTRQGT